MRRRGARTRSSDMVPALTPERMAELLEAEREEAGLTEERRVVLRTDAGEGESEDGGAHEDE